MPASGAASRMFKNLFEFLGADYDTPQTSFEKTFFEKIEKFAFYDDLNTACQRTAGKDMPALVAAGNYKAVVAALLETAGLNYGALPKGLLKFHKYPEGFIKIVEFEYRQSNHILKTLRCTETCM